MIFYKHALSEVFNRLNIFRAVNGTQSNYKTYLLDVQKQKYLGKISENGEKYDINIRRVNEIRNDAFQKLSKVIRDRKIL